MELVTYRTRPDLGKGDQVGAPEATSGGVETAHVPEREGKGGGGISRKSVGIPVLDWLIRLSKLNLRA